MSNLAMSDKTGDLGGGADETERDGQHQDNPCIDVHKLQSGSLCVYVYTSIHTSTGI